MLLLPRYQVDLTLIRVPVSNGSSFPILMLLHVQEKGGDDPSEDTMSTSSSVPSVLDTSHDSSYEARKISSISVHETMQTPTHRNSFISASTPVPLKTKISAAIGPISEEKADPEPEAGLKRTKGPAPPPPQTTPPPSKQQRSVSEAAAPGGRDGAESPVLASVRGGGQGEAGLHTQAEAADSLVESESGDTLVDSEDEDLSPEKERVLQMLDSVIQEQEESCLGGDLTEDSDEEAEARLHTPEPASAAAQSPPPAEQDDEPICISSSSTSTLSSAASSSSSTSSPSSPVQHPATPLEDQCAPASASHLLSPRPTSISPGASRPDTPKSSKSSSSAAAATTSPRSLSPSPSPSPSMDRPSPDGSSTGGSPLPPWPKSRSPSPKNNVEVTVIELAPSSLDSGDTPAAPPSSLTATSPSTSPSITSPAPATPDRHVSVIVVGNHQDYKVQDSSSIGSPSPQAQITDQRLLEFETKAASVVESLSPPPGFESTSSDHESMSSLSEDGRKSATSKQSGTSLRIAGTTTEETSTDLSLDLGNMNLNSSVVSETSDVQERLESTDSEKETESVPEEPIIPVLKSETPKKVKSVEPKRQDSVHKNNNNHIDRPNKGSKVSKESRPEKTKRSSVNVEDREKSAKHDADRKRIAAEEEERRRIAQEVREGRERYDRRSQDRLDDVGPRHNGEPHQEAFVTRSKGESRQNRKESVQNHLVEAKTPNKKEIDSSSRLEKSVNKEKSVPDLVQKSQAQVYNGKKQEIYKKTQRSTSEATGLHPAVNNSYSQDSDEDKVILRKKPVSAAPEPDSTLNETPEIGSAIERKKPLTKEDIQKMNLKKKTRKRTRKFEIDGVTVTTTTSKVIYRDEESETFYDEHYFRKQELRELKMLQKQEQKQFQDLAFKNQLYRDQQEKRFDTERVTLVKNYENDLTSMVDGQKKQVDKCENQQQDELKVSSKRIRNEQDKELKTFRESLKQETKLLKHEVELLPKDRRKEALKIRKDQLEREHIDRERCFLDRLNESHETHMKRLSDTHREKIALLGECDL